MSSVWSSAASIVAVAALWGCTNPLLSRGSQGMEKQAQGDADAGSGAGRAPRSIARRLARETLFLISNWRVRQACIHSGWGWHAHRLY